MSLIIAGLISNPQLRHTSDGKQVCDFLFIFNQRLGQTTVSRQIEASAWNLNAEAIMQSFPEGGYVILEANYRDDVIEREGTREHQHSLSVMQVHLGNEGLELNAISLVGIAGLDSETLTFESGTTKSSNRLGIRRTQEITDCIGIEAWGKTATTMANYVGKGKQIAIEGSFKIDSWTDKATGQERFKPVVLVERLTLLGNGNRSGAAQPEEGSADVGSSAADLTAATNRKPAKAAAKTASQKSAIPF